MSRFHKGDVILSPEEAARIKFVFLPPRESSPQFTALPYSGPPPPEWWFRFGLHYVLMAAIVSAWLGCLVLAIFFLSGGAR
ncbi:hypothetical protein KAW64_14755 [bacterium]|nr:hypothetical protein [bacterium]